MTAGERVAIKLGVNGVETSAEVAPRLLLSDFLRHRLHLTGTHVGCEHGVCGACTVLVDGAAVRSCLMFAVQADGAEVSTVESLTEPDGSMGPIQQAFHDHHGLQCGFCTPGILMSFAALHESDPNASQDDVERVLGGHLCRCTGYRNIVGAAGQIFGFDTALRETATGTALPEISWFDDHRPAAHPGASAEAGSGVDPGEGA
jgi:aerobic-type carbon monoxide dehydrogenase small subunit (CoxS/CutS family)